MRSVVVLNSMSGSTLLRLSEACKELAVTLTLVEGKDAWG